MCISGLTLPLRYFWFTDHRFLSQCFLFAWLGSVPDPALERNSSESSEGHEVDTSVKYALRAPSFTKGDADSDDDRYRVEESSYLDRKTFRIDRSTLHPSPPSPFTHTHAPGIRSSLDTMASVFCRMEEKVTASQPVCQQKLST